MLAPVTSVKDNFGRKFYYLRLSITDVCNFRCQYCLPNGYQGKDRNFLSIEEIIRTARVFSELGMQKIRLTGGEPTLRKDFIEIITQLKRIKTIEKMALTTNGYHLNKYAMQYYQAGLTDINISIDSLDPKIFNNIVQQNKFSDVLAGVHKALKVGFHHVKINTVLLKSVNDDLSGFLEFIKDHKVCLRLIELMKNGTNKDYFNRYHVSVDQQIKRLENTGWQRLQSAKDAGPAIVYAHPSYRGTIGFIAPYSKNFCATCNRLRVSARGELFLCLFGNIGYNLRPLLQSDQQRDELKEYIIDKLQYKAASHYLEQGITGKNLNFSKIGG